MKALDITWFQPYNNSTPIPTQRRILTQTQSTTKP